MNRALEYFRNAVRGLGFDVVRYTPSKSSSARMRKLLASHKIATTIDVGANVGQFAQRMRRDYCFCGRIISFEPIVSAFEVLRAVSRSDCRWDVHGFGLGDRDEVRQLNISENSQSSSLLNILPLHLKVAPQSRVVAQESIDLRRLDKVWVDLAVSDDPVFLKLDVQGFERQVLDGAVGVLDRVSVVQLEVSAVPLYEGEMLFSEAVDRMRVSGLMLSSCEPSFTDEELGSALQFDCVFARRRVE